MSCVHVFVIQQIFAWKMFSPQWEGIKGHERQFKADEKAQSHNLLLIQSLAEIDC